MDRLASGFVRVPSSRRVLWAVNSISTADSLRTGRLLHAGQWPHPFSAAAVSAEDDSGNVARCEPRWETSPAPTSDPDRHRFEGNRAGESGRPRRRASRARAGLGRSPPATAATPRSAVSATKAATPPAAIDGAEMIGRSRQVSPLQRSRVRGRFYELTRREGPCHQNGGCLNAASRGPTNTGRGIANGAVF